MQQQKGGSNTSFWWEKTLYCFLGCPEASGLTDFPQNRAVLRGCGCDSLWLCLPARTGTQKSQSSGLYSCLVSQRYWTSNLCPFSPVGKTQNKANSSPQEQWAGRRGRGRDRKMRTQHSPKVSGVALRRGGVGWGRDIDISLQFNRQSFPKCELGWETHMVSRLCPELPWSVCWWVVSSPKTPPQPPRRLNLPKFCSGTQINAVLCSVCLTVNDSMNCSPPGSSVHGDSPGKNTGVGYLSLLQRNFLTQESNQGLLYYRWVLYQLSYQGSPK